LDAGALVGDEVEMENVLIKADGTVQLSAHSVAFGTGSATGLTVWPLTDGCADLQQGGQVPPNLPSQQQAYHRGKILMASGS